MQIYHWIIIILALGDLGWISVFSRINRLSNHLSALNETIARIDERTKAFDERIERLENWKNGQK